MDEVVLLSVADQFSEIENSLAEAGFRSCLVDRDWMHRNATDDEWRDFRTYKSEYAREVILSSKPAMIERSNPGEYSWRSADISRRVTERFERFGDVHAVFLDSSKRHLTKLTVVAQRLSKMLERASPAAIRDYERRHEEFERRRRSELQRSTSDPVVRQIFKLPGANADTARRIFARMVIGRALANMSAIDATTIRFACMGDSNVECIDFQLEVDPEEFLPATRGALYMSAICRLANSSQAPNKRRLAIERLLPDEFRGYSRFSTESEFALCFDAWLHIAVFMATALMNANCRATWV